MTRIKLQPGYAFPTVPRPFDLQVYKRAPGVEGVRLYFFDVAERIEDAPNGEQRVYYRAGGVVQVIGHRLVWIEPERH